MIKKIIFVTFLFIGLSSYGQDINELRKKASLSSDSELVVFIQKAKGSRTIINGCRKTTYF